MSKTRMLLELAVALTCIAAVNLLMLGCKHLMSKDNISKASEATYTAELLQCVDKATTLEDSKECRHSVDARWSVAADGGL